MTVSEEYKKTQPRRRRAKPIKGLTADAKALGVSRYFLWKVLRGFGTSAPLLARYQQLKEQQS